MARKEKGLSEKIKDISGLQGRKRLTCSIAVLVALVTVFTGITATPALASSNFYDPSGMCQVTVIWVRGSGEASGAGTAHSGRVYQYGGQGAMLSAGIEAAMLQDAELPIYEEAIVYPAVIFDTQYNYFQSEGIGVTNLRNEITYLINQCPYVTILLGGYSQGAQVIGDVLVGLSAAQRNHIGAVTLWGDPSYRRSEVYDDNPATPDSGILAAHRPHSRHTRVRSGRRVQLLQSRFPTFAHIATLAMPFARISTRSA